MSRTSGRYWLLTIPQPNFLPWLPPNTNWIKGQLEQGDNTGFLHWQILVLFKQTVRLSAVRKTFGEYHAELSRSEAAEQYVWKEDTAIPGTRFEIGQKPFQRNNSADWEAVWKSAINGRLLDIPAEIRVPHYKTLCNIAKDHMQPIAVEKTVNVYWGATGSGKSTRAWEEAGLDAYPKDPNSKFWDGYRGHEHVVIDEFRGRIDIGHMLRWLDKWPVQVDIKFGGTILVARRIWITSNLDPREWYPELDEETKNALMRRLNVVYYPNLRQ